MCSLHAVREVKFVCAVRAFRMLSCSASYSRGSGFESRSEDLLSRLQFFVIFFNPFRTMVV
jgi:hypothetical protein